jgi:hypothetical protein
MRSAAIPWHGTAKCSICTLDRRRRRPTADTQQRRAHLTPPDRPAADRIESQLKADPRHDHGIGKAGNALRPPACPLLAELSSRSAPSRRWLCGRRPCPRRHQLTNLRVALGMRCIQTVASPWPARSADDDLRRRGSWLASSRIAVNREEEKLVTSAIGRPSPDLGPDDGP